LNKGKLQKFTFACKGSLMERSEERFGTQAAGAVCWAIASLRYGRSAFAVALIGELLI